LKSLVMTLTGSFPCCSHTLRNFATCKMYYNSKVFAILGLRAGFRIRNDLA
jgi:hypothetical protein